MANTPMPATSKHSAPLPLFPRHTNLIFDVALPEDMTAKKGEIKTRLDQSLNQNAEHTYFTVITFDPEAFNR